MEAPAGPRAQVFVVVPQMPYQVACLLTADAEVVCKAGDSPQCVVGVRAGGVDLAEDRVFGAGEAGERRHRGPDTVAALVVADRIQ